MRSGLGALAVAGMFALAPLGGSGPDAFAAPAAPAGPFGIAMGSHPTGMIPVPNTFGLYALSRAPVPNANFPTVQVEYFPTTGVCKVIATSPMNRTDMNGTVGKAEVDAMAEVLAAKYGPYKKVDDCDDSDGLCSTALTTKLLQKAARYGYAWTFDGPPRPDHVHQVAVFLYAVNAITTMASLVYAGDQTSACAAAEKTANGAGL